MMEIEWSPLNAMKALLQTLHLCKVKNVHENEVQKYGLDGTTIIEPHGGIELLSALAAGNNAKLILDITTSQRQNSVTPSLTLALAVAANQTSGKLICIRPTSHSCYGLDHLTDHVGHASGAIDLRVGDACEIVNDIQPTSHSSYGLHHLMDHASGAIDLRVSDPCGMVNDIRPTSRSFYGLNHLMDHVVHASGAIDLRVGDPCERVNDIRPIISHSCYGLDHLANHVGHGSGAIDLKVGDPFEMVNNIRHVDFVVIDCTNLDPTSLRVLCEKLDINPRGAIIVVNNILCREQGVVIVDQVLKSKKGVKCSVTTLPVGSCGGFQLIVKIKSNLKCQKRRKHKRFLLLLMIDGFVDVEPMSRSDN